MTIRFLIRILTCLLVMLTFGVSAGSALADDPATPPAVTMTDEDGGSAPAADAPAPAPGAADADANTSPADASTSPADASTSPADASTSPVDASTSPVDASTSPADTSTDDDEAPVKSPAASDDDGATPAPTSVPPSTSAPAQPALVTSAAQPTPVARAAASAPPLAAARVSAPRPSRVPPPTVLVASADRAVSAVASPDRASKRALVAALTFRTRERSASACPKRAPVRRRWSNRSQLPSVAQNSVPVREPGGTGTAGGSSGSATGAASPATRLLGVVTRPPAFATWWSYRWPSLASWRSTFVTSVLERPD
jgi:hypothetical protein